VLAARSTSEVEGPLSSLGVLQPSTGILTMSLGSRSEFLANPYAESTSQGSFDCVVVRGANDNFAQDDKLGKLAVVRVREAH